MLQIIGLLFPETAIIHKVVKAIQIAGPTLTAITTRVIGVQ